MEWLRRGFKRLANALKLGVKWGWTEFCYPPRHRRGLLRRSMAFLRCIWYELAFEWECDSCGDQWCIPFGGRYNQCKYCIEQEEAVAEAEEYNPIADPYGW